MKKFVVIFLLLGLALLSLPGYIGFQAEDRYRVMIDQLEKGGLQVGAHRYRRGWFGADAETELVIPLARMDMAGPEEPKAFHFTLQSKLVHGPLLPEGGFGLAEIDSAILVDGENIFPADYPALLRTHIAWDGAGETLVDLPATRLEGRADRPRIEFKGLRGRATMDAGFSHARIQAHLAGVKINEGGDRLLEIGNVSLNSQSRRDGDGLMLGGGRIDVGSFELLDMGRAVSLRLAGIAIDVESTAQAGMVSGAVSYRLESAQISGEDYGPAQLKLSMGNLPATVLLKLQHAMEDIQRLPQDQQPMAAVSVLLESGPELLKADPKFAVERLSIKTPEGDIEGRFALQPVGLQWSEVGNFQMVLNKLESQLALRMPVSFFKTLFAQQARAQLMRDLQMRRQTGEALEMPGPKALQQMVDAAAEAQIDRLLAQEVLVRDGEVLATEASLSSGLLSVNGKTIPLFMSAQPPELAE